MSLGRQAQRQQRAAVESALEADHRRPLRVRARELDRVLNRFGAGVEERSFRRAGDRHSLDETFAERDVRLVGDDREVGVQEFCGLFLNCVDDTRMRVADVEAADASGEVDEGIAVDVCERRALAALDHHRQKDGKRVRDHAVLPFQDLLGAGPRDRRSQLDRLRRRHASDDSGVSGRLVYLYRGVA